MAQVANGGSPQTCYKDASIFGRQALRSSKASGIKPFISKLKALIFPFHGPISKRLNLCRLRLKLFVISHQHVQFFHSFFIPFPFENLPKMKSWCLQV